MFFFHLGVEGSDLGPSLLGTGHFTCVAVGVAQGDVYFVPGGGGNDLVPVDSNAHNVVDHLWGGQVLIPHKGLYGLKGAHVSSS